MDPDISGGDAPDMIHLGSTSGRVIWERWRGCFALLNVVANVSQGPTNVPGFGFGGT